MTRDFRIPDMRGSRVLELRDNTYGHRAWAPSVAGSHDSVPGPVATR